MGCSDYCNMHLKMFKEKAISLVTGLNKKITDWKAFITKLRQSADKEDINIIEYKRFLQILQEYGTVLSEKEKELVMQSFVSN